jgi:membrane fusion protein (multidrug efflux system)
MRPLILFIINCFFNFNIFAEVVNVRVNKLSDFTFYETTQSLGVLNKIESEDYVSTLNGKITYLLDQNSQEVKKGQKIISIDGGYADSFLEAAKQSKIKAENDYNNSLKLFDQKLLSKQNLQLSKSIYLKSISDYESQLKQFENQVFYAPFDGTIGSIAYKVGDNIAIGDFLFSIVGQKDGATINFNLSSSIVGKINLSSEVWIDNYGEKIFGKIISISPYLSKKTGDFLVKVEFANTKSLIHNQYYNAYFQYNTHSGLAVLENSILSSESGNFIYIVDDNIVKKINVKTMCRTNGFVEIISNEIKVGDLVIIEGLNKVFQASKVKIIE